MMKNLKNVQIHKKGEINAIMIIDLTEFDKLKNFIFEENVEEAHPYFTEYCYECEHPEENNKCEYQKCV